MQMYFRNSLCIPLGLRNTKCLLPTTHIMQHLAHIERILMPQGNPIALPDNGCFVVYFPPIDIRAIGAMVFQGQYVAIAGDGGMRATDGGVLRIYNNR